MARILIVDDERDVTTMLTFILEKDGHAVASVHDGAQALAALGIDPPDQAKAAPDLVLMDVMMPVMDGNAVSRRMNDDPRTKSVPVLMLTAKGSTPQKYTPNVAAHLDKPFNPKDLRALIKSTLKDKP